MQILAGDIGGTKTLLQLAEVSLDSYQIIQERRYKSQEYATFDSVVTAFLKTIDQELSSLQHACFGVAGPVVNSTHNQTAQITNLPWSLDAKHLTAQLNIPHVYLVNDFQAAGFGIDAINKDDLVVLQTGQVKKHAPRLIVGAGTGFGVAQLIWQTDHYQPYASEAGHADFAPVTTEQIKLLDCLMANTSYVPNECLLSGTGLVNIYKFLGEQSSKSSATLLEGEDEDPAATITNLALNHHDQLADQALDLFVSIYGGITGNLALVNLARGGVYIAGGIAPKIIERLTTGMFIKAFTNKNKMSPLLSTIPVAVVMNPNVGLLGAAMAAYYYASKDPGLND